MIEKEISHIFDIDPASYWTRLFFNQEYNEALFLGRLKFEAWKVESQEEDSQQIRRVVYAVPPMPDLPGPLRKVLKDGLGYRERGVFDKAEQRYRTTIETASLADKVHVSGVTRTEARGDGHCARIHRVNAEAKIFGVGGLLESRLVHDLERSYEKAAVFSNQWLLKH